MSKRSLPTLWWFKFILSLCAIIFGIVYIIPTLMGNPSDWKRNSNGQALTWVQRLSESMLPSSRINLGLDLKGGLSLTLNVEVDKAVQESIGRAVSRAKELAADDNIKTGSFKINADNSTSIEIVDLSKTKELQQKVAAQTTLLLFDKIQDNQLIYQPNLSLISEFKKQVMQQAINTIRNRIDQFGVAEPNIFQAGDARIVVELPGMTDIDHAKQLLGNTAQLDFRMVLNVIPQTQLNGLLNSQRTLLNISTNDNQPASIEKLSSALRDAGKIPQNSTILLHRSYGTGADSGKIISAIPYLVEAHAKLTGDMIEDAQAGQSQENFVPQYAVSLKFKPEGSKLFGDLTTTAFKPENNPHEIAIILDSDVQSAPVVNGPILGGNASITMGRNSNLQIQMKESQDLALVLRAGALPASVKVIEERQIGPSEGAQNIHAGVISTAIAAVLVILVMLIIYGLAGVVANIAMLLNVLLILAFMALFSATLTLPGIAGIVLTMAIAVDGNVVINERIREEIRSGLSQKQAFYKGYNSSFKTLIDAHITSAVAGIVLIIYGNPTVKGFAVTLLTGIICTLFTSFYVTEVIGQWLVEKTNTKRFG